MKALWFLPFTFAAGAEGFALFAPYLVAMLSLLYFVRCYREFKPVRVPATVRFVERRRGLSIPADIHPAL